MIFNLTKRLTRAFSSPLVLVIGFILMGFSAEAQMVKGNVRSEKEPLVGASVVVKGTTKGAITEQLLPL